MFNLDLLINNLKHSLALWMPKWLIHWALIRAFAIASGHLPSDREAGTITLFEAVKALDVE